MKVEVEVAVVYRGKQVHCLPNPTQVEWEIAHWVLLPNGSYTGCKPSKSSRRKALKVQAKYST